MGCFVFLLSLIGPRLALGYVWIFTTFVDRAYDNAVIPVLGFVFLPWTTLTYALSYDGNGVSGIGWFFVARGLIGVVSALRSWLLLGIPMLDLWRLPSLLMLILCVVGFTSTSRRVHGVIVVIGMIRLILGTGYLWFQPGVLGPSQ